MSYAKVRTLTRIAVDHPDRQGELIDLARDCTAAALPAELARWTAAEEDPEVRDRRHHRDTALTVRTEPDGTALITLRLPPLAAAQAMAAIDTHAKSTTPRPNTQSGENTTADAPPPRNVATRRASLAQQRAWAAHHLLTNGGQNVTTEILIHVRDDGATLTGGTPISDHVLAQLAPTAFFRALIHDANQRPINASGRQRNPTTRQQRVVAKRDNHTCTHPGCTATTYLEHDHQPPYNATRHTITDELHLLCAKHHRQRHQP